VRWWEDGRQHEKSFKRNHKLAASFAREAEAGKLSIRRGDSPPPVSLKSYAETWLDGLSAPGNTVRTYRSALRNHVLPQHGRRPLAEVAADREGVQALLRSLAPGTARVVLTTLRAMMTEAAEAGRIGTDRLRKLEAGSLDPLEFRFPSYKQLAELAAGMRELGPAIWIMRGCGLRPSEALAVRRKPDRPGGPGFYGDGRLRVMQQQLPDGALGPLKSRKPGDFRDVPVPGYVTEAVENLDDGRLFAIEGSWFRRRFRAAANAAGLEGFRAHDLRHVFASVALSEGMPVPDVSRWLGHRDIQTTYRTYFHYVPNSFDRARAALDAEYERWSDQP
jgi:integrase